MFSLENKNAFITGGASGIGRAVAERFIRADAAVVIADISDGTDVAAEIGAKFVHIDVGNEESVANALQEAVDKLGGKLDIVCNNAGVGDIGFTIEDTRQSMIEKVTRINQWGVMYGLKHAPKHMNDHGSIINTASLAGLKATPGTAVYSAAKSAVISMTRTSAIELGRRGIRVNAVCPAYIDTALGSGGGGDILSEMFTALGRKGTTDDVVGAFHFLAADEGAYISAHALPIDGGWMAGIPLQLMAKLTGSELAPD